MPRREYDRQRPQKSNTALIVGLAVGGVILILVVAVASAVVYLQAHKRSISDPANKVYTREEFRELVIGKMTDEIIAAIGKPSDTFDNEDSTPRSWTYSKRVVNPVTGNIESAFIDFKDKVAVGIRW